MDGTGIPAPNGVAAGAHASANGTVGAARASVFRRRKGSRGGPQSDLPPPGAAGGSGAPGAGPLPTLGGAATASTTAMGAGAGAGSATGGGAGGGGGSPSHGRSANMHVNPLRNGRTGLRVGGRVKGGVPYSLASGPVPGLGVSVRLLPFLCCWRPLAGSRVWEPGEGGRARGASSHPRTSTPPRPPSLARGLCCTDGRP